MGDMGRQPRQLLRSKAIEAFLQLCSGHMHDMGIGNIRRRVDSCKDETNAKRGAMCCLACQCYPHSMGSLLRREGWSGTEESRPFRRDLRVAREDEGGFGAGAAGCVWCKVTSSMDEELRLWREG